MVFEENYEEVRVRRSKKPKMNRRQKYEYKKRYRRKVRHLIELLILLAASIGYLIAWIGI